MRFVDEHGVVLTAGYVAEHRLGLDVTNKRDKPLVVVGVLGFRRTSDAVSLQHLVAPGMKRTHLHTIFDAALLHHIFEPPGDAVGEAEDEHRLGGRTRQVFRPEREDERLSGSGDATNDSVAFA